MHYFPHRTPYGPALDSTAHKRQQQPIVALIRRPQRCQVTGAHFAGGDQPVAAAPGKRGLAQGVAHQHVGHQAGTPPDVVGLIQQEVARSLATPAMKERLLAQGAIPGGNTPAEFAQHIDNEHKKWAQVVKTSGAKVD